MRILARTLVILAAALVVAGGAFALVQSSYAQALLPAGPERGASVEGPAAAGASEAAGTAPTSNGAPAFREHDHAGGRSPSLFGAVEVIENLAIVGIIVAAVSLVRRVWPARRPDRPRAPAAAP